MFNTRYYSFASSPQWRAAQGVKGKFDLDRPQVNMAVMAVKFVTAVTASGSVKFLPAM